MEFLSGGEESTFLSGLERQHFTPLLWSFKTCLSGHIDLKFCECFLWLPGERIPRAGYPTNVGVGHPIDVVAGYPVDLVAGYLSDAVAGYPTKLRDRILSRTLHRDT
ncbi:hypothetical protein LWI28_018874 [Acer negundo]|uniref:Uncharacterized protein n=1 Tax=Acer negundo TaxID=4023 RepID=A0AAD5I7I2_ACENE|nr:hypothetical protein LWI28_018874 [Acer negundo]